MAAEEQLHGDDDDLLKGWKDIARFLHTSERTVQRWEHALHLPIHRAGTPTASVVYTTRTELRNWLQSTEGVEPAVDPSAADGAPTADGSAAAPLGGPVDAIRASPESTTEAAATWPSRLRWLALTVVALVSMGVVYWYAGLAEWGRSAPATPQAATGVGGQASQASAPAMMLLRLTSTEGTWSVVGIPYGGMAMSTRIGDVSVLLTAVRIGDESRVHLSRVETGARGGTSGLGEASVITLRQGGSATPTGVSGLAKIEWLRDSELPLPKPSQPRHAP